MKLHPLLYVRVKQILKCQYGETVPLRPLLPSTGLDNFWVARFGKLFLILSWLASACLDRHQGAKIEKLNSCSTIALCHGREFLGREPVHGICAPLFYG